MSEQLDLFNGGFDKMKVNTRDLSKRMGAAAKAAASAPAGAMNRAELVTTVRRLGYVALRVHEVVMGRLTTDQRYELAEQFNDLFKPLADMLVHFELKDDGKEDNDGELP